MVDLPLWIALLGGACALLSAGAGLMVIHHRRALHGPDSQPEKRQRRD